MPICGSGSEEHQISSIHLHSSFIPVLYTLSCQFYTRSISILFTLSRLFYTRSFSSSMHYLHHPFIQTSIYLVPNPPLFTLAGIFPNPYVILIHTVHVYAVLSSWYLLFGSQSHATHLLIYVGCRYVQFSWMLTPIRNIYTNSMAPTENCWTNKSLTSQQPCCQIIG